MTVTKSRLSAHSLRCRKSGAISPRLFASRYAITRRRPIPRGQAKLPLLQTLTGSQCLSSRFLPIGRKYGHLVKALWTRHISHDDTAKFLKRLPIISGDLDYFQVPILASLYAGASRDRVHNIVGAVVRRSATISIPSGQWESVLPLCSGPAIKKIVVVEEACAGNTFDTLLTAITACPSLVELDLDLLPRTWTNPSDDLSEPSLPWPAVKRLSVVTMDSAIQVQVLLTSLSKTLEVLELEVNAQTPEHDPFAVGIIFPHLHSIIIKGDEFATVQLISKMSSKTFPSLRNLSWRTHPWSPDPPLQADVLAHLRLGLANFASPPIPLNVYCRLPRDWKLADEDIVAALQAPTGVVLIRDDGDNRHYYMREEDMVKLEP